MQQRHMIQFRPKDVPGSLPYSPQRDLAYLYPAAVKEAFMGLDKVHWQEYFAGWLAATDTTEDALGQGVQLFCDAHNLFVGDPTITAPWQALERTGFLALPAPVRIMIFERLGEVITGGFFIAVREVTRKGDESPNAGDIADMFSVGEAIGRRLRGEPPPLPAESELRAARLDAELRSARRALQSHKKQLEGSAYAERQLSAAIIAAAPYEIAGKLVESASIWRRFCVACRILFLGRILS